MSDATSALESVIANEELNRRPSRPPLHEAETRALEELDRSLAIAPRRVLQNLVHLAKDLCQAHSAGVSLLEEENGKRFFRWHAVAGAWAPLLWTMLPREFSPCGTVLDRRSAQFMIAPARYFTPMLELSPQVSEVVLIPFAVGGELTGTVWVVSHDETRRFDREDRRIVSSLAAFAAKAYEKLSALHAEEVVRLAVLPAHERPATAPRAAVQKRVLVVDDNVEAAQSLALLLRAMGHEVRVAHDGSAALDSAAQVRPDIVLLDIAMPGMSGLEVARRLRQRFAAQIRIVALSGFGQEEDRRQALEAGFDLHVMKPADPAFLKSLFR